MATAIVNTDLIDSPQAEDYFTRADRRVMIGLRVALEMLDLPTPDYAQRRKPGVTPAKTVLAAFHADHPPAFSAALAERRPNADAAAIARSQARNLHRRLTAA